MTSKRLRICLIVASFYFVFSWNIKSVASMKNCTSNKFACHDGKKCIPLKWVCDGNLDCSDGSDELDKDEQKCVTNCKSNKFACHDGKECIPLKWVCDGNPDCSDGSDELDKDEQKCVHTCTPNNEFTCASGECISTKWICDRSEDCADGSDESPTLCHYEDKPCDEFRCNSSGKCISLNWKCDNSLDCDDGSDEENCATTCDTNEFQCKNDACISLRWLCDDEQDCSDNSDETNCAPKESCPHGEFLCKNKKNCIVDEYVCDGDKDCNDGSDESNCTVTENKGACSSTEFACKAYPYDCIPEAWKCDGDEDCSDGSDEPGECVITCKEHQFQCFSGHRCIHELFKCDGTKQCMDGSDEHNCVTTPNCSKLQFDCNNNGRLCIDLNQVCDGVNDCGHFQDESRDNTQCRGLNPCEDNNGNCSHTCINKYKSHACACHQGYELQDDGRCLDINECIEIPGVCSQTCINTIGSYKCTCKAGYQLVRQHFCKSVGRPLLIIANRKDIRQIDLDSRDFRLVVSNLSGAIALDMHYKKNKIYWTDVTLHQIQTGVVSHNGSIDHEETLVNTDVLRPDGLAVDWIHNLLFWTDTGRNTIEVLSLDKGAKYRKTIIWEHLDEPRAIITDPAHGYIYWSDWGVNAKIERSGMDGSERRVIIDKDVVDIGWPNALTFDYVSEKLYWMDAKYHLVAMTDRNGLHPKIIKVDPYIIGHPFALAVFEDQLYWTDWSTESIHSINKFTGEESKTMIRLKSPMDIRIFHSHSQMQAIDRCKGNPCDHICLPTPKGAAVMYRCTCSDVHETCVHDDIKKSRPNNVTDETHQATHKNSVDASKHHEATTASVLVNAMATTASGYVIVTDSDHGARHNESLAGHVGAHHHYGLVAGVVVGAVVLLIALMSLVAFFVYKRRSKGQLAMLNFDNPVYRKTTEENCAIDKTPLSRNIPSTLQPLAENEYV